VGRDEDVDMPGAEGMIAFAMEHERNGADL
jgi:hypothetical protein